MLETFKDGAIILATLFAIYGIDAWRREHVGKRRIELAEEVLALFYEAKDVIAAMRSPFSFAGEGTSRNPGAHESPDLKVALDSAYVLVERYNRNSAVFSRIYALRYRFIASFGVDLAAPFEELNRVVTDLMLSANDLAQINSIPSQLITERGMDSHLKRRSEIHKVYCSGSKDDPIAHRVDTVISQIEATCRSIIDGRNTIFHLFNYSISISKGFKKGGAW